MQIMKMKMKMKMKILKLKKKFPWERTQQIKMKIKILRIDESGYVSNKKIDISKIKYMPKISPKKLKKLLEEIDKVETWCKKNR